MMTPSGIDALIEELRPGHGERSNHHRKHSAECRFCRAYAALVVLRREVRYLRHYAGDDGARAYAALRNNELGDDKE